MTALTPPQPREADPLSSLNFDGHTLEELSAYLDAERLPPNFSIEASAGCQIALAALGRLRELTAHALEAQAAAEPAPPDRWVQNIMGRIALEARAASASPSGQASTTARLAVNEGAVRRLVRAAGDSVPRVIVGRCEIEGDVTAPGEPVTVTVEISVAWGENLPRTAGRVRAAIHRDLLSLTELRVDAIHIIVQDVRVVRATPAEVTGS
jgi:hypothetical protein